MSNINNKFILKNKGYFIGIFGSTKNHTALKFLYSGKKKDSFKNCLLKVLWERKESTQGKVYDYMYKQNKYVVKIWQKRTEYFS